MWRTAFSEESRTQCSAKPDSRFAKSQLSQSQRRLCPGAQSQMQEAVQPPASLVAVASVCLRAASPNAQCKQAVCRKARCLTRQSTGHAPASRVMPVISNVSRLVSECVASVPCLGRCACGHSRLKVVRKAVPLLHPIGSSGAGCPSAGGQRTAEAVRYRLKLVHRACVGQ